jgi:threonine synthase
MINFSGYRCSLCGAEYTPVEITYTCPKDGGNLDVVLDFAKIRQQYQLKDIFTSPEASLWRYLPLLPVSDPGGIGTTLRAAGWTPVFRPLRLAVKLGMRQLWIKDESRNPTASFKDRASAILIGRAKDIGAEVVVTASTGNAGAALAGMAAAVGQKAIIFAPRTAPTAKIAQLLVYGAQVILVDGSYDDAFDLHDPGSRGIWLVLQEHGIQSVHRRREKNRCTGNLGVDVARVSIGNNVWKATLDICIGRRWKYHLGYP